MSTFVENNPTLKAAINELKALGNLQPSTIAPDGLIETVYPAKINDLVVSKFNGKTNGLRAHCTLDAGTTVFCSIKGNEEQLSALIPEQSVSVRVYPFGDKGNLYCKVEL